MGENEIVSANEYLETVKQVGAFLWQLGSYVLWTCAWLGLVAWLAGETVPYWAWSLAAVFGYIRFRVSLIDSYAGINRNLIERTVNELGNTQGGLLRHIKDSERASQVLPDPDTPYQYN